MDYQIYGGLVLCLYWILGYTEDGSVLGCILRTGSGSLLNCRVYRGQTRTRSVKNSRVYDGMVLGLWRTEF